MKFGVGYISNKASRADACHQPSLDTAKPTKAFQRQPEIITPPKTMLDTYKVPEAMNARKILSHNNKMTKVN